MRADEIKSFLGQHVSLRKTDNFALNGIIEMVYTDSILFSTSQETSLIRIEDIEQIKMKKTQN